jgi:hypothetical protein
MDAQLRLDINRLKSQKEEMKKATEGDQFGVYAYLREKDSAHGKAGSPYYIGRMADAKRPWGRHTTPIPPDPRRVRLLRGGLTEQEANDWEKFYIKKFGRIDLGTGGLRNLTDGGEGISNPSAARRAQMSAAGKGKTHSAETRAKLSAVLRNPSPELRAQRSEARRRNTAAKYGINPDLYLALSEKQRSLIAGRYALGKRGSDLLENLEVAGTNVNLDMLRAAERYGIDVSILAKYDRKARSLISSRYVRGLRGNELLEDLGNSERNPFSVATARKFEMTYEQWELFTPAERALISARYSRGQRGKELLANIGDGVNPRLLQAAKKYEIDLQTFIQIGLKNRQIVSVRYRRGKRGAALLEGLI